jgi:hypothetical protein
LEACHFIVTVLLLRWKQVAQRTKRQPLSAQGNIAETVATEKE